MPSVWGGAVQGLVGHLSSQPASGLEATELAGVTREMGLRLGSTRQSRLHIASAPRGLHRTLCYIIDFDNVMFSDIHITVHTW